jgi:hypothetical protein
MRIFAGRFTTEGTLYSFFLILERKKNDELPETSSGVATSSSVANLFQYYIIFTLIANRKTKSVGMVRYV